eukprot:CAMPEP_0115227628 /NCGR_PEP_ID=MMETSP0270-20121206/31242_1 /TAXON_ID=71861 /ORGANISM="Scrippsiella trochoidea, Strain CCMP3099" /LENGTH=41 /DNA_ID= /DNA_START= /DNA_END= /DNA_ORIENTATION=
MADGAQMRIFCEGLPQHCPSLYLVLTSPQVISVPWHTPSGS